MKKYLFSLSLSLSLLLCGAASADDLTSANALFAKKSYPQAMQLYTKSANAGNAEAQLRMGEMHLYGEAGSVDLVKAEAWFRKSAAKGNKTAVAALDMMKQRELRRADIEFWMSKYDGADMKSGQFRCPVPRLPAMSKQNDDIAVIAAKVQAWQACYNGFVENINAATPFTTRIPKDIADLLTKDELAKATLYLEGVKARIIEDARLTSKLLLADYAVWRDATDAYVGEHNRMLKDEAAKRRK